MINAGTAKFFTKEAEVMANKSYLLAIEGSITQAAKKGMHSVTLQEVIPKVCELLRINGFSVETDRGYTVIKW